MFATDRDLLVLEPHLMRDVAWLGQRLVNGTGTVAGTTLTLVSSDADLAAAGVGAGHVVLVGGVAYEVLARLSATSATISRLRAGPGEPALPPTPIATPTSVVVLTFAPQIGLVHEQVLRMLGLKSGATQGEEIGEDRVSNPRDLARVEALGAVHLVLAAASAPGDGIWNEGLLARAKVYRERFASERVRATALIDLDGDGEPDASRRMNVVQFVRG